jgi:hypothetical protein
MFVLGLLVAVAALDPWKHRLVVYGLCGVLFLRVLQRLALQQDIQDAFHISPARDLGMAAFFVAEAVAILVLLHRVGKTAADGEIRSLPPVAQGKEPTNEELMIAQHTRRLLGGRRAQNE